MKTLTKAQRIKINYNRIEQAKELLKDSVYSKDEALRAIDLFKSNIVKLLTSKNE